MAHIFLVLTPAGEPGTQLQIMAAIAKLGREPQVMDEILRAKTPTALLAALRIAEGQRPAAASRSA